jgi:hypothetical protein
MWSTGTVGPEEENASLDDEVEGHFIVALPVTPVTVTVLIISRQIPVRTGQ